MGKKPKSPSSESCHRLFKSSCLLRRALPGTGKVTTRSALARAAARLVRTKGLSEQGKGKKGSFQLDRETAALAGVRDFSEDAGRKTTMDFGRFLRRVGRRHLIPLKEAELELIRKKAEEDADGAEGNEMKESGGGFSVTEEGVVVRKGQTAEEEGPADQEADPEDAEAPPASKRRRRRNRLPRRSLPPLRQMEVAGGPVGAGGAGGGSGSGGVFSVLGLPSPVEAVRSNFQCVIQ